MASFAVPGGAFCLCRLQARSSIGHEKRLGAPAMPPGHEARRRKTRHETQLENVARELKPYWPCSAVIAAPKVQSDENLDVFKIEILSNPANIAGLRAGFA